MSCSCTPDPTRKGLGGSFGYTCIFGHALLLLDKTEPVYGGVELCRSLYDSKNTCTYIWELFRYDLSCMVALYTKFRPTGTKPDTTSYSQTLQTFNVF